jgi:uncharacterized BrkB/YihY/UPF0761 family membrane protein
MKTKSMGDLNKNLDEKLSLVIKDSFELTVSNDFDKKVREEINRRIIHKRLMSRYLIVVGVLILFLIGVVCFYYVRAVNGLSDLNNIQHLTGIWKYKYLSLVVLSLSLVFTLDKLFKLKNLKSL